MFPERRACISGLLCKLYNIWWHYCCSLDMLLSWKRMMYSSTCSCTWFWILESDSLRIFLTSLAPTSESEHSYPVRAAKFSRRELTFWDSGPICWRNCTIVFMKFWVYSNISTVLWLNLFWYSGSWRPAESSWAPMVIFDKFCWSVKVSKLSNCRRSAACCNF